MFTTLESTWDQSARRGRATLASFTIQALSLSLLCAVSMLWVERPPQVRWLQIPAPTTFSPAEPAPPKPAVHQHVTAATVSNVFRGHVITPQFIPLHAAQVDDSKLGPPAPNLPDIEFRSGRGSHDGVPYGLGDNMPVVMPAHPTVVKPLVVSNLGEGGLLRRVQPTIPPLPARRAFRAQSSCRRSSVRRGRSSIWPWSADIRCWPQPRWKRSGNGVIVRIF